MQAYIVPKNDEFFSGYLAKEKDRLYQLTNFTGSNGMAIVFSPKVMDPKTNQPRKPIFITDNRYKLQSSLEIDKSLFDI